MDDRVQSEILKALTGLTQALSIASIARKTEINKHTVARNLDTLELLGKVRKIYHGTAKKYYLSQNVPFSAVIDISPDLVVILDNTLTIQYVNSAAGTYAGVNPATVIGQKLHSTNLDIFTTPDVIEGLKHFSPDTIFHCDTKVERNNNIEYFSISILAINLHIREKLIGIIAVNITEKEKIKNILQDSEKKYRLLVDLAHEGVWLINAEGITTFVNPRATNMLGFPQQDLIDKPITILLQKEDKKKFNAFFEKLKRGKPNHNTYTLVKKDGSRIIVLISASPIIDSNGSFSGIVTVVTDITDKVLIENELRESEERYHTLFEHAPIPMCEEDFSDFKRCIDQVRSQGIKDFHNYFEEHPEEVFRYFSLVRIIDVNAECVRFFKASSKKELIINKDSIFVEESWTVIREQLIALAEGKTEFTSETQIQDLSGRIRHIIFKLSIDPSGTKTLSRVQISFIDITKINNITKALRVSLEKYRVLFESFPIGVTISDNQGNIIETNRISEKIFGVSKSELKQRRVGEEDGSIIRVDGQPMPPEEYASIRAFREDRIVENIEMGVIKNPGEVTWITATAAPIPLDGYGIVSTFYDITDRINAQKEKDRQEHQFRDLAESIKDVFFSLDHEMRYTYWNEATERITGIPAKDATQKNLKDLVHPLSNAEIEEILITVLNERKPAQYLHTFTGDGFTRYYDMRVFPTNEGVAVIATDVSEEHNTKIALKESRTQLKTIVDSFNGFICTFNLDNRITYMNDPLLSWAGRDAIGEFCYSLLFGQDSICPWCPWDKITQGENCKYEVYNPKDGHWYYILNSPISHFDGTISRQSVILDISEKKATERALLESHLFNRQIISNVAEGVTVYDKNFRYLLWNPFMEKLTGVLSQDVIGKNALDLFPHLRQEKVVLLLKKALSGETVRSPDTPYNIPQTNRAGWVSGIYSPNRNADGDIIGVVGIISDITERKCMEEALHKSEEEYRNIFDSAIEGIFQTSSKSKIIRVNRACATMFGFKSPDEFLNTISESKNLFADSKVFDKIKRILVEKQIVIGYEIEFIRHDGDQFWGSLDVKSVSNCNGDILNYEGIIVDITEKKHAEMELKCSSQSLREANKKINLLSSVTRHDILNNITSMKGYLHLMQEQTDDPVLQTYLTKQKKLVNNVQYLIEFTRNFKSIGENVPEWHNIKTIIFDIFSDFQNIPISLNCECSNFEIYADGLVAKVFFHFIENSIKNGEHVTSIRINSQISKKNLIIQYSDDGIGIDMEEKEKIFEYGYSKNTGFGLFLIREILAITDIRIQETGIPGVGARFEMIVPPGRYRSCLDPSIPVLGETRE